MGGGLGEGGEIRKTGPADSGKHAFSVIGGGLKPQWLNMGGGLGEGGEIRETGPADLITTLGGLGAKIESKTASEN